MTANLHLFGRLARVGKDLKETPLYFKDFKRTPALIEYFRKKKPHIIGLQEVWDPKIQQLVGAHLKDIYPYQFYTPWELGVSQAVKAIGHTLGIHDDTLEDASADIVEQLAKAHYQVTNALIFRVFGAFISEDMAVRIAKRLFNIRHLWGAGLMFLSQYPIEKMESNFHPFESKAGHERLVNKGSLKVVVYVPGMGPTAIQLSHLNEGKSKHARRAREEQLRFMRSIIDKCDYPGLAIGDFNIERDTIIGHPDDPDVNFGFSKEYERMLEILNYRDAYVQTHSLWTLKKNPGLTYLDGPFARQLGVPDSTDEQAMTIDYVLYDRNWVPSNAFVDDSDDFYLDEDNRKVPLSDHRPLIVEMRRRM